MSKLPSISIRKLSEMASGEVGDCFVLLSGKEVSKTRDGKPFYRVFFRDANREVTAMVWSDTAWFKQCDEEWTKGFFYKVRCRYSETQYGPQIEIDNIRDVVEEDHEQGFTPSDFYLSSRYDPDLLYSELIEIIKDQVKNPSVQALVIQILTDHEAQIKEMPAAKRNHHAFRGGYLEHVLSVTKNALLLAEKYRDDYQTMSPPLSVSLVVAGAVLHDIGKLIELNVVGPETTYSARGKLIGHILLGRDIVRESACKIQDFPPEILLRLEHIIVSHQNLPEWGSPVAPHTPEALIVHYADDLDAKFQMMAMAVIDESDEETDFTSRSNPLRREIYLGMNREDFDQDESETKTIS